MKAKNYALRIAGTIFGIVSLIHLLRLLTDVPVIIADWQLPLWVNVLGLIATAILCAVLWCLSLKKDKVNKGALTA